MTNLMTRDQARHWDPFEMARELMRWDPFGLPRSIAPMEPVFSPSFDVRETEDGFVIEADMPGIAEDDLDLSITGNQVQISGERRREVKPEDSRYHLFERHYGKFIRSFTLPADADVDNIEASLDDGVLTLRVPKKEGAKSRKISFVQRIKQKLQS